MMADFIVGLQKVNSSLFSLSSCSLFLGVLPFFQERANPVCLIENMVRPEQFVLYGFFAITFKGNELDGTSATLVIP